MKKNWLSLTLIVLAGIEVITLRWIGVDMTEGQLFVIFWPAWMSIILLLIIAAALIKPEE
jgi:hypothetical protein